MKSLRPLPSISPIRLALIAFLHAFGWGAQAADYTISTSGGSIVITDTTVIGDTLTVSEPSAGNIKFAATGRTFSLNGATQTNNDSGDISLTGATSITINTAAGADSIAIGAFVTALPALTVNAGTGDDTVNFNGDLTFAANASLNVDLQNDAVTPGVDTVNLASNANLVTSGTGTITVKASSSVVLNTGSSLETENGGITVEANQQLAATAGNTPGLFLLGGTVQTRGSGPVVLRGKSGANATTVQRGVSISGGHVISSSALAGAGSIDITGRGEAGYTNGAVGTFIANSGEVTSASGAIRVTGTTGSGDGGSTSVNSIGVGLSTAGSIAATNGAAITIDATAGTVENGFSFGLQATDPSTRITANNGNIAITSGGADAPGAPAVTLGSAGARIISSARITTDGTGSITLNGTAGNSSTSCQGVRLDAPAFISTVDGNITLAGTGGTGGEGANHGSSIRGAVTASGTGSVSITGSAGIPGPPVTPPQIRNGSQGVQLRGGAIVSSTGGNITINGTGSTISGSEGIGIGVFGAGTGKVEINAPTRSVSLIADTIDVDPTLGTVAAGTGTVTLRQKNPGRRINLGAADSATVLGLTDAELDRITAGTVVVGNSNSGAITISGVLSPASFRALDIRRGVDFSPTGGFASDVTSATVFESIKVNGDTTIDSSATLAVTATGGFTVAAGDTFTILDNSSVGLTTGNFSGKPAGTVIVLNGTQKALTYLGGTGNDVVLDTLSAATDSDRNGFSDFEEAAVAAQPSHFTVGETITSIDLSSIVLQGLEKLVVAGLPPGLELNPANNHIEGTIKGELGAAGVEIRKVLGRRIVSSLSFGMSVAPYPLLGGYEALLERDGLPVGRAKLLFTAAGSFSATLELLGEAPRSAKGPFPITAATTQTVPVFFREGTGGVPASTQVLFHLDSTSDQFTGEHVGDTVRGFRLVKPDRSQPQRMTCEFHTPGDRVNTPGGHGFGTGALNANGLLSVSGSLGDGQPFTLALNLSQTNQAVIFLQPYAVKSTSFFGGIMELPGLFAPERGGSGQTQPPGAGLLWKKAEMANATSYRNGFGPLSVSSSLSKWFPSITAEGLALSLDLKLRQIEATYDVPPAGVLPSRFELRNAFTLIRSLPTNSVPWKGQAVASNGTFSGTLTLPVPAAKTSVTGVFLQDLSFGNQIGTGLIKIPIADVGLPKGSFETAGVTLSHN